MAQMIMVFLKKLNKTQTKNMFDLVNSSTWFLKSMTDLLNRIIGECQLNNENTHTNAHYHKSSFYHPRYRYSNPPADKNTEKWKLSKQSPAKLHISLINLYRKRIAITILLHYELTKVYKISRNIAMQFVFYRKIKKSFFTRLSTVTTGHTMKSNFSQKNSYWVVYVCLCDLISHFPLWKI